MNIIFKKEKLITCNKCADYGDTVIELDNGEQQLICQSCVKKNKAKINNQF